MNPAHKFKNLSSNLILPRVEGVRDLETGFWIGWSDILTPRNYRQYNAITDRHTLKFTVTHAIGFSVFTSHILTTDFNSLTVTSNQTFFIPPNSFLTITLQLSTLLPKLIFRRLQTRLFSAHYFARTRQKTQSLYCWGGVFTVPLHSNGSYSIFACVFVAAGMCLPGRCLEMNVYSEFHISAFGRHDTIFSPRVLNSHRVFPSYFPTTYSLRFSFLPYVRLAWS
jgi:hypothetical protein